MNAFLFPGQGSQEVGMGKEIYNNISAAANLLEKANDMLGYNLKEIMFNGPIEKLTDTRFAQPAIYTCSAMYLEKAKADCVDYTYVAGHSLGEYSALYAAGIVSFEDGLKLVSKRGEAMAVQNGRGTMAAVLGLTETELQPYMNDSVVMANLNSKTQIVISGTNAGVDNVALMLKDKIDTGEIKFKKIFVSAAFHSPQMDEVAKIMCEEITKTSFSDPKCYFVPNVTGVPTKNLFDIKENLIKQITSQVRWYDTINSIMSKNVDLFYECGHGNILKRINKTITLKPKCLNISEVS